ncbi:MAG: oligosaccharide flippase family protein [bacterium]|nr:oligosaccharide flippase family protein [bacterium]
MKTTDITLIKQRAVSGVLALISRTFLLQVISFIAAGVLLPAFLSPTEYGVFFIVSAAANFFAYFSDVGLAAALIQKKETVTEEDLRTTFTIQEILVVSLVLIINLIAPTLGRWYKLSPDGILLLRVLSLGLFFSSLKTIPAVILERNLNFKRLIIPQIAENLIFNSCVVILAWQGWGIRSFTVAVFFQGLIGAVLMYLISPWRVGFAFNIKALKNLLKFGLPYQTNTFLAVVKDDLMIGFLGGVVGPAGMGFLGWAQKWASMPLRIFMDNITKVAFPAYSRLQDDKIALRKAIESSLFFLAFFIFPLSVGIALISRPLVFLIPRYLKWEPALIPLYLYCFGAAFSVISTPLTTTLNAIGKIKVTLKLMIMWTVLTWAITPFLALRFGFLGAAFAAGIIAPSSLIPVFVLKRYLDFSLWKNIRLPLFSAIFMGAVVGFLLNSRPLTAISLTVSIIIGGLIYLGTITFFAKDRLIGAKRLFTVK